MAALTLGALSLVGKAAPAAEVLAASAIPARAVAIGGADVSAARISHLSTRSGVGTLTSSAQVQVDMYAQTQLQSFAVQGWQSRPYLVSYSSSDESICTVDSTGLVTGISAGSAVITATATDAEGHTATGTCEVFVRYAAPPIEGLTLNRSKVTLRLGGTGSDLTADYTVLDEAAVLPALRWVSSDTSVCTVDETGHVTAVGEGTAVVTAAIGPAMAECAVTVKDTMLRPVGGIDLLNFDFDMLVSIGNQTPLRCSWYALRYARTILDGEISSGKGYWWDGAVWSNAGYYPYNDNLDGCLDKLYTELSAGRPVIVHLKNARGQNRCTTYEYWQSGSGWAKQTYPHRATSSYYGHWVLVVGVASDADPNNLNESDFFALDPARMTDGSRLCLTRLMDGTIWTSNSPLKVTG